MNQTFADETSLQHSSFQGQIGVARGDITPPVGIYSRNWGAALHDVAESIHRPLTLTVLAIGNEQGSVQQVLIDADLGWWRSAELFTSFQKRLTSEFSLEDHQLIFALTHTHAGPPLIAPDSELPGIELTKTWLEEVLQTAVTTVRAAISDLSDAILDWHTGRCALASNRDLPAPDGAQGEYLCGFNPTVDPDDTLIVGRISDLQGNLRGTLVNYACHPTTLAAENKAISPDYIGAMRETMQQATGAPALFLLGACGELAPRHQYVGDTAVADSHGRELGFSALSTLNAMNPPGTELAFAGEIASGAPLAMWKHRTRQPALSLSSRQVQVELPLKDWPTAAELEQQRRECTDRVLEERLRRKRDIRQRLGDGQTFTLPVYLWRLGDAVLVGSCCEAYSILQQQLRQRFPENTIICMNLINGTIGYLPPQELYEFNIYPVWQTPFDKGSLELLIERMTQEIHDLLN